MPITVVQNELFVEFSPSGELTADMVIATIRERYPHLGTRGALWDFTHVKQNKVTAEHHAAIALAVGETRLSERVVQTAFVVSSGDWFARMWSYCNEAFALRLRVEYRVFGRPEPAARWLTLGPM